MQRFDGSDRPEGPEGHGRRRRRRRRSTAPRTARLAALGVAATLLLTWAVALGSGSVTPVADDPVRRPADGTTDGGAGGTGPTGTPAAGTGGPGPAVLGEPLVTSAPPWSARPSPSREPSGPSSGSGPGRSTATRGASSGTRLGGVYVTAYSWFDNTPPGSSTVSNPVLHRRAGGSGTYADPVTVAVGHDRSSGRDVLDHPAGTRFYLPYLRRYVIVEDTCGDGPAPQDGPCHDLSQAPAGTTLWLDVWMDGAEGTPADVEACAARLTGAGGRTAVLDPPPGLPVLAGPIFTSRCNLP